MVALLFLRRLRGGRRKTKLPPSRSIMNRLFCDPPVSLRTERTLSFPGMSACASIHSWRAGQRSNPSKSSSINSPPLLVCHGLAFAGTGTKRVGVSTCNPAGGGSNGVSLEPQRGGAENRPLLFAVSPPAGGNCDQADANIFLISEEVTGRRASPTR